MNKAKRLMSQPLSLLGKKMIKFLDFSPILSTFLTFPWLENLQLIGRFSTVPSHLGNLEKRPVTHDVESMLVYCWSNVVYGGPALNQPSEAYVLQSVLLQLVNKIGIKINQHWFSVMPLLGKIYPVIMNMSDLLGWVPVCRWPCLRLAAPGSSVRPERHNTSHWVSPQRYHTVSHTTHPILHMSQECTQVYTTDYTEVSHCVTYKSSYTTHVSGVYASVHSRLHWGITLCHIQLILYYTCLRSVRKCTQQITLGESTEVSHCVTYNSLYTTRVYTSKREITEESNRHQKDTIVFQVPTEVQCITLRYQSILHLLIPWTRVHKRAGDNWGYWILIITGWTV